MLGTEPGDFTETLMRRIDSVVRAGTALIVLLTGAPGAAPASVHRPADGHRACRPDSAEECGAFLEAVADSAAVSSAAIGMTFLLWERADHPQNDHLIGRDGVTYSCVSSSST